MPDLLFELRTEELPAKDVRAAAGALEVALRDALTAAGLAPESTSAAWTPRRIALFATRVPLRSPDREERVKGPRVAAAFDAAGAPTKAAEGFARKVGVTAADLMRDGEFTWAAVRTPGRDAAAVIAETLPLLPSKAGWRKTMRWGVAQTFARPIRGVVAIFGSDIVGCEIAGLRSGRTTQGHRFLVPEPIELATADRTSYLGALRAAKVVADPGERRAAVLGVASAAWPGIAPREELIEEVVNLVEWPSAMLGGFATKYLELPPRLLVTVMEHHQRFFPCYDGAGALAPHFVAIRDREQDTAETSRRGFERVLVPRLHDAMFFLAEDRKTPFRDRLERLRTVTYHRKLGTLFDKAERLAATCASIAPSLGADPEQAAAAGRLAKCDLVTQLVGEFPELQGHVGSVYAALDGEAPAVAEALDWQYRHDFDGCAAPSPVALTLVLAENLDIVCQFGTKVGLPTGSTDPFGVRRAALALIDACERWAPSLRLTDALTAAGGDAAVFAFLDTRLRQRFRDRGVPPDHLDAIGAWNSVGEFRGKADDLAALALLPEFDALLQVAERCRNITKKSDAPQAAVREELLVEPAEIALFASWGPHRHLAAGGAVVGRAEVAAIVSTLAAPLQRFFEDVLVNADDAAVRTNRHALLREIDATILRFADLCKVVRKRA
ncbi:MAG: glycine--tRNA ligase subunit beta [Planctomycetes bacterium]|nr:glycine--tRNA ligase subunit beta [Planctomycetota bacterium]